MADRRAFITGITGFKGSHLADLLLADEWEVYGLVRPRSRLDNVTHLGNRVHLVQGDIRDESSMRSVLSAVEPDRVWHFAAQAFVPLSLSAPMDTLDTNIRGTVNLLEALRGAPNGTRALICSSCEVYGLQSPEEIPVKETNALRPQSPYAVSKVACDLLAAQYHRAYGLHLVRTRSFNCEGPRRGESYMTSTFAKQVAEIEAGKRQILFHGNLDAMRDITDVRDTVRAYATALEKCRAGDVYNICSGTGRSAREVLEVLVNLAKAKVPTRQDPARMRPSDVPVFVGDCSKFRTQTGWEPTLPFDRTMADLLDYWRNLV